MGACGVVNGPSKPFHPHSTSHNSSTTPFPYDSVQSHKKFKEKAGLPFQLLSDPKKEVARKFHNLRGRNVLRTTAMIDPQGKILKVWADIPENQVRPAISHFTDPNRCISLTIFPPTT